MCKRNNRARAVHGASHLSAICLSVSLLLATPCRAADRAVLAETLDANNWHLSDDHDEAVFIGQKGKDQPVLALPKSALADQPLVLNVICDAPYCDVASDDAQIRFAITPGRPVRITLDGSQDRPRLAIDGRQPPDLRGDWIRLILQTQSPNVSLTFVNATYATVRFGSVDPIQQQIYTRDEVQSRSSDDDAPNEERPQNRTGKMRRYELSGNEPLWSPSMQGGVDFILGYFYHGIGQEDNNLIVQPWADVTINLTNHDDVFPWIDGLDLHMGMRSSHHFGDTGKNPDGGREKFYELDFRGGGTLRFLDRWAVDLSYVNRIGINDRFGDVHQFELAVEFDDHDPAYAIQLWPYALVVLEFEGESDGGNRRGPGFETGIYLELGIKPEFDFYWLGETRPLTVAVPAKIGLSLSNYFEDPTGEDDTFGFVQLGAEASYPVIVARAPAGRQFALKVLASVDVLFLGSALEDLSNENGTGGNSVEIIGRLGAALDF